MRGRGFSDAPAALTGARRILLVRLDNIGDVVLLSPAIAAIRQACPDAELTLLASPAGALAAPLLPAIDHVIEHRASWQQLDPGAVEASTERALIEQDVSRRKRAARVDSAAAAFILQGALDRLRACPGSGS